jgi:hypothetical protein
MVRHAGRNEARDAMTNASVSIPPVPPNLHTTLGGLRRFNAGLGVLYLVQAIAMLAGMYDIASQLPIFALNAAMILFGFSLFALNMLLLYRRVGLWRECLFGERVYMPLSLLAKSALAWPVFAGTLPPA